MDELKHIKDSPLFGAEFCQYHPQFYAGFKGPIHKMDSSHHLSAVKDGERMRLGEFQHAEWAGYLQLCANIVPVLADRIEALEAALRDASDKAAVIAEAWVRRAMHLSPDGYEIERHHGAMASQAANDIRRAITAPLHPTPSPDPQSNAETAPR